MSQLDTVVDGDTQILGGDKLRTAGIDTPESVHSDSSRNTPKGKEATALAKAVLPKDAEVEVASYGRDHFGRNISKTTRVGGGVEVDLGLVQLDQQMSEYNVQFGEHPDPRAHKEYAAYYSEYAPYQYGERSEPLSAAEFKDYGQRHENFTETYQRFKDGDATQEEFDAALIHLYGDRGMAVRYRETLYNFGQGTQDMPVGSDRYGHELAMSSPEVREAYNFAQQNGEMHEAGRDEPPTWTEILSSSFQLFNTVSNVIDTEEMIWAGAVQDDDIEIPEQQYLANVPVQYHDAIRNTYETRGATAAIVQRDQTIQDVEDHEVFDDLSWYAQFGYGAVATIVDPTALAGGAALGAVGAKTIQAGTAIGTNLARNAALTGSRSWAAHGWTHGTKMATWAGMGAAETALVSVPMLDGDHTYTPRDLQLDILVGAGFGAGLGGVVEYAAKPLYGKYKTRQINYTAELQEARAKELAEVETTAQRTVDKVTTPKLDNIQQVEQFEAQERAVVPQQVSVGVQRLLGQEVEQFNNISTVKGDGFTIAQNAAAKHFPTNTPIGKLLSRQGKLARTGLEGEEGKLVEQLNADVLQIAAAYKDKRMPKGMQARINALAYSQTTNVKKNVIDNIQDGTSLDPAGDLAAYTKDLRSRDLFDGQQVGSQSLDDFTNEHAALLGFDDAPFLDTGSNIDVYDPSYSNSELEGLMPETWNRTVSNLRGEALPQEVKLVQEALEIAQAAQRSGLPQYVKASNDFNAIVSARLRAKYEGNATDYVDKSKQIGKRQKASPQEVIAQLKAEGLFGKPNPEYTEKVTAFKKSLEEMRASKKEMAADLKKYKQTLADQGIRPQTDAYYKRKAELEDAGVKASEEVQAVGRIDKFQQETREYKTDEELDSIYYGGEDQKTARERGQDTTVIRTESEDDAKGLLPRSTVETVKKDVYKEPTLDNLREMKARMAKLKVDVGIKLVKGKAESERQHARLEKIAQMLHKDVPSTIERLKQSNDFANVIDTIRVSEELSRLRKKQNAEAAVTTPPKEGEVATVDPLETPLSEDELHDVITGENVEPDSQARVKAAVDHKADDDAQAVADALTQYVASGEAEVAKLANKPNGILDGAGRLAAKATKDLATVFNESDSVALNYVGSRITELGRGYGGAARRRANTGGIARDAAYRDSVMQVLPDLFKAMDDFARSKGKGAYGRMSAQQKAGADNKITQEFYNGVWKAQQAKRQGKPVPHLHKSITDFADKWDKYMDYNHSQLVDNGIDGFTAARKVKNYIPHVWHKTELLRAVERNPEKVEALFVKSYMSEQPDISKQEAVNLAKGHIEWITKDVTDDTDQYLPTVDARSRKRMALDPTVELDGMSMLDFLESDLKTLASKYSNRVAGWVGMAKSTDGLLTSNNAIEALRANVELTADKKGVELYDDLVNMMFGRPTRGGLNQELRMFKDLTALTRMGGLGTAQLIETGQVITRNVVQFFSDPKTFAKVFKLAGESTENKALMEEIQAISGLTNDLEYLDMQSVHLDQKELAVISKARQLSLRAADAATFGSAKAPASRLLGKVTGYNMIRKGQSRIAQASFVLDAANHFKHGKGKMSNARRADLGLTEVDGTNAELSDVFNNIVEYDGNGQVSKLNADKWPQHVREQFQYSMIRDEAQQIQRTLVGELPPWMNKPMMALIFQFREMPLVANNKALSRSLAFADAEAYTAVVLNAAMSGLVRASKFALLGLGAAAITGEDWKEPTAEQMDVSKYITQFGIFADAYDLVLDAQSSIKNNQAEKVAAEVPILGLMKDYVELGKGMYDKDVNHMIESAHGLVPLGNTVGGDAVFKTLQEQLGD